MHAETVPLVKGIEEVGNYATVLTVWVFEACC